MSNDRIYLTTTLPYVNDRPHIGHALEFVQADLVARTYRLLGNEVYFNVGTDEHGQKIFQKSLESGQEPQDYVDHYAETFKQLVAKFNISNDTFIRTTDDYHIMAACEMWRRCNQSGDIYKKEFTGKYCVGCELFLTDRDLIDGKCPDHNREPEVITTENYFFRFSRYQQPLLDYLQSGQVIIPDHARNWAIQFVESGLEDFSISRHKDQLTWGIPVPDDDDHVMYVWFDALTNYISTLGWPSTISNEKVIDKPDGHDESSLFEEFWNQGVTHQFAGKDQIRMQSLMWQAMLMSAGEQPTDRIFYHGFITSGGQKMSKTIGNVIDPLELIDEYSTDVLRYYLLRHIHPIDDSDVTRDKFAESYNAHLVNGLGNLVARVLTMVNKYEVEYQPQSMDEVMQDQEAENYFDLIKNFKFNEALDWLWDELSKLDEYIATEEPYKTFKTNELKAKSDVAYCVIRLHELMIMLQPVMPDTAETILTAIESKQKPDNLFPRK